MIHYKIKNKTIELEYDTGVDFQIIMNFIRLTELIQTKNGGE